jgi:hypothetical protein
LDSRAQRSASEAGILTRNHTTEMTFELPAVYREGLAISRDSPAVSRHRMAVNTDPSAVSRDPPTVSSDTAPWIGDVRRMIHDTLGV